MAYFWLIISASRWLVSLRKVFNRTSSSDQSSGAGLRQVQESVSEIQPDNGSSDDRLDNLERPASKDFWQVFKSLERRTKMCFLCFAAIPENKDVRKRFMIYWWISEGFLSQEKSGAEECHEEADRIFEELVKKDCIKPVNSKGNFAVSSYMMDSSIRSAAIALAEKSWFLDFHEEKGYPAFCTSSHRVCMVNGFSKNRRERDYALFKRLREMDLDSNLFKTLLTKEIELEILSKDSGERYSRLVKILWEIKIDPELFSKDSRKGDSELVERLRQIIIDSELDKILQEIDSELVKKLQEMNSQLLKIFPKYSEKKHYELTKRLEKKEMNYYLITRLWRIGRDIKSVKRLLETDSELFEKLEAIHCVLVKGFSKKRGKRHFSFIKRLWEIGMHAALVKRLLEMDHLAVKRLLKTKLGTELINRLLEMEKDGELLKGFFLELAERFCELKSINQLVNKMSLNFGEGGSEWVDEHSSELMKIGAELVYGYPEVLEEIGTELIDRFCEQLSKRGRLTEFYTKLRDKWVELHNEHSNEFRKLGAELVYGPSEMFWKEAIASVKGSSEELGKRSAGSVNQPRSKPGNEGFGLDPREVQIIFNVNKHYPDFFDPKWFSNLKNVKILYLGRWQTSPKHHIEIRHNNFLRWLPSMKHLKFFSLQGIFGIMKLPDSLSMLSNLRILDLRACHNLEELPIWIGSLKELTHLDTSECYLLTHMPEGIKYLSKLKVLKGFVISSNSRVKSCNLKDLSGLKKLRKLNIYTNRKSFPTDKEVKTFHKFKKLQKLTITWGAGESQTGGDTMVGKRARVCLRLWKCAYAKQGKGLAPENKKEGQMPDKTNEGSFQELQKLDLKSYPWEKAPSWLLPNKIPRLKKLYIRGGKLESLSLAQENDRWKVEILRLKFLHKLKMDWTELRSSFPNLVYLETVECPELNSLPPTENGIWVKDENINLVMNSLGCSSQGDLRLLKS